MGKITHVSEGTHVLKQQNTRKMEGQDFQKALDAALENKKSTPGAAEEMKIPVQSLGEITPTALFPVEPASTDIFERTNFLLDKLDSYTKELENPKKTLKDIEPLIAAIQDEAGKLLLDANGAGESDDTLKEIVNQTAIKASTEYIKFNRGDYI